MMTRPNQVGAVQLTGNHITCASRAAAKRNWLCLQGTGSTKGMELVGDCLRGTNCPLGTSSDCMASYNNTLSSARHVQEKSRTKGLKG